MTLDAGVMRADQRAACHRRLVGTAVVHLAPYGKAGRKRCGGDDLQTRGAAVRSRALRAAR